jgi:hypothetical protein
VQLAYAGPWWVQLAFWMSLATGGVIAAGAAQRLALRWFPGSAWARASRGFGERLVRRLAHIARAASRWAWRERLPLFACSVILLVGGLTLNHWLRWREAAGPIRVRFELPRGETNRAQPVVVTGHPGAGTFVYLVYADPRHVRVGIDVWGRFGTESAPIPVDYFDRQELVVSTGALFPAHHPKLAGLPPETQARLRRHVHITLNGVTAIDADLPADDFPTRAGEITIGENHIGGSHCEPRFTGRIFSADRMPVAAGIAQR